MTEAVAWGSEDDWEPLDEVASEPEAKPAVALPSAGPTNRTPSQIGSGTGPARGPVPEAKPAPAATLDFFNDMEPTYVPPRRLDPTANAARTPGMPSETRSDRLLLKHAAAHVESSDVGNGWGDGEEDMGGLED
jgi:hypothetical protein